MSLMHIMGQQGSITTTSVLGALRILDNNPGSGKHSWLLLYIPSKIQSEYVLAGTRRKLRRKGWAIGSDTPLPIITLQSHFAYNLTGLSRVH